MKIKNRINIILFERAALDGKVFFDALANLELPHSIINLRNINQISAYLDAVNTRVPNILIFYVTKHSDVYLRQIRAIRQQAKPQTFSILLYDPLEAINEEEAFAAGANIYMHKPKEAKQFKIKLRRLFSINSQYLNDNLPNETFFLTV